jgi:maltose alpha-D-glucosyltransferase/alpha-amylase
MNNDFTILAKLWNELYHGQHTEMLEAFMPELEKESLAVELPLPENEWYKDAVVYSLYVDLFNKDFAGLIDKLDYLQDLGVNCLWLLPVLDSPMRDAGFDIRDYRKIRKDLAGLGETAPDEEVDRLFQEFIDETHQRGMKVIFDIATNHISDQHFWFREARKSKDNPYRDYFIWSKDGSEYADARIIFHGIEESNWKKEGEEFYFHRFFDFQPDLNYKNPKVLLEISRILLYWLRRGVDGFRADAIPYIWKEEGTPCENHPMTHTVVKFFRAVIETVRPNTLLLAEACQKPHEVVKYFGDGDECNAGYHFPLMPQIFKALALGKPSPIINTLSPQVTPAIPQGAQWFTFLRCHDELSLELVYVTEDDRRYIHENYCHQPEWDFRLGQGISARLSELMQRDPARIGLIFSIMLTLPGTPVLYYGDEFGKLNDEDYYREMIRMVGKDDTRFLVRGKINWKKLAIALADPQSYESKVLTQVRAMLRARNTYRVFGRGEIQWTDVETDKNGNCSVLAYYRVWDKLKLLIVHNLSPGKVSLKIDENIKESVIGFDPVVKNGVLELDGFGYDWLLIKEV